MGKPYPLSTCYFDLFLLSVHTVARSVIPEIVWCYGLGWGCPYTLTQHTYTPTSPPAHM